VPDQEITLALKRSRQFIALLLASFLIFSIYFGYKEVKEHNLEEQKAFNETLDEAYLDGAYQILVSIATSKEPFIINLGNETDPLFFEFGARVVQPEVQG